MSIYNAGTVADVVGSVAAQGSSTEAGARWLNAYIDPAHGNCDTVPDEDNVYSTPLKSHFTYTLDNNFFATTGFNGTLPATRSFTVYLTNFPDYPIAVYGTFYSADWPNGQNELVFIKDPNLYTTLNSSGLNELRFMYKGMTLRYAGNHYDDQGVITSAQISNPTNYEKNTMEYQSGFFVNWQSNGFLMPVTSQDIAASNKEFYVNRQDVGVYCSNQLMGQRSKYISSLLPGYMIGGVIGDNNTVPLGRFVRDEQYRFYAVAQSPPNQYWAGSQFALNTTWTVVRYDNIDVNQSILIEHFGGYQCHVSAPSALVNFQSFKSYLDPNALATASQLTASIPCIWPASYNDFKAVWRRIGGFIGSATGQSLVSSIARISGRYGGLISAIGGLFV